MLPVRRKKLLWTFLISLSFIFSMERLSSFLDSPITELKEPLVLVVPKGRGLSAISDELSKKGLLSWPKLYVAYAQASSQTSIFAGEYLIYPGSSLKNILKILTDGDVVKYKLTIPEGLRSRDFLDLLARQPKLSHQLNGLSDAEIIATLGGKCIVFLVLGGTLRLNLLILGLPVDPLESILVSFYGSGAGPWTPFALFLQNARKRYKTKNRKKRYFGN